MADTLTTTTSAVFIPEVWSVETLRAAESELVMAPLVKRYDSLVKQRGDTIHIPHISNLTANDKTQTAEVTLQNPTETETTIAVDQWKETSFEIEDIVKVQSQYDLRSEYTSKAGSSHNGNQYHRGGGRSLQNGRIQALPGKTAIEHRQQKGEKRSYSRSLCGCSNSGE